MRSSLNRTSPLRGGDAPGTGQNFDRLQAVEFKGAKALNDKGYAYKNWSPRIGLTYDLTGNGRNVAKISYARYIGQAGTGNLSSTHTTTGSLSYVSYPSGSPTLPSSTSGSTSP